jgi:hypothetical protein
MRQVASVLHRPLRMIFGARRPPLEGFLPETNLAVCSKLCTCPVAWDGALIIFARVRLAIKLSVASGFVLALVQCAGDKRWRLALTWSLHAFKLLLPERLVSLPNSLAQLAAWEASWMASPASWWALTRLGRRRAAEQPFFAAVALVACPLPAAGAHLHDDSLDSDDDEAMHMDCGKVFPMLAGATCRRGTCSWLWCRYVHPGVLGQCYLSCLLSGLSLSHSVDAAPSSS